MHPQTFDFSDLFSVLILVVLEGLLSGDNALVLAVIVMALPERERRRALQYGIVGAFVLRTIATLVAVWLVNVSWVSLVGGLYLLWLPYKHFTQRSDEEMSEEAKAAASRRRILGLSPFWSTVLMVEAVDLVFAVDSILAAVAMTHGRLDKTWVVITGGLLGILMMRLLTLQVLELVRRFPKLIDGAYVVITWVGIKLVWEYLHRQHIVPFGIPKEVSIAVVLLLFAGSFVVAYLHAKREPARREPAGEVETLFTAGPPAREEDAPLAPGPAPDRSSH